jgi:hypothetical protein
VYGRWFLNEYLLIAIGVGISAVYLHIIHMDDPQTSIESKRENIDVCGCSSGTFFLFDRIQQQQLARIYSLLSENKDSFGDVSFDDVRTQMNMYSQM